MAASEADRGAREHTAADLLAHAGSPGGGEDPESRLARLQEQLTAARHDVLTTRDHIIGIEAENARLRKELGRAEWIVRRLQKRKRLQQREIKRLRQVADGLRQERRQLRDQTARLRVRAEGQSRELAELRGSWSWRMGRGLTAPLRALRR